jgi:Kef-type K+ transport system membrane component KefB
MEHDFLVLTEWILLAVTASLLSIRLKVAVVLMEVIVGALAGNLIHIEVTQWVNILASFGAVTLVFVAGAEIEPEGLKRNLKECTVIGLLSFLLPFLIVTTVAYFYLGWDRNASMIAGLAMSTTAVAVVYAVIAESGLAVTRLGQSMLASCFVTDFATVVALGVLFTGYSLKLVWFATITGAVVTFANPLASRLFAKYGGRICELEIKFIFLLTAALAYIAVVSEIEAVLPAFILGLAMAGFFVQYKEILHRMRVIVYVAFTPFFFIKAGALISLPVIWTTGGTVLVFMVCSVLSKCTAVLPMSLVFGYSKRDGTFFSLLMSVGLSFGSIAALFGLTKNLITGDQYSILVAAVILRAIVPTVIADKYFSPVKQSQTNIDKTI